MECKIASPIHLTIRTVRATVNLSCKVAGKKKAVFLYVDKLSTELMPSVSVEQTETYQQPLK